MRQITIIFPNQLFRKSPLLKLVFDILMIEDSLFFGNDKHFELVNHINKLIFLKPLKTLWEKPIPTDVE